MVHHVRDLQSSGTISLSRFNKTDPFKGLGTKAVVLDRVRELNGILIVVCHRASLSYLDQEPIPRVRISYCISELRGEIDITPTEVYRQYCLHGFRMSVAALDAFGHERRC